MKFSNGCWLEKEGCSCFSPQEVYFTRIEKNKVTLCAPTIRIITRGDTLGSINLTVVITSPAKGVIRVQTCHHAGMLAKSPAFELNTSEDNMSVTETDELITITSGDLSLEITKLPWSMTYKHKGRVLSKSGRKDLALMKTDWKGYAYDKGDYTDTYIRQQLSMGVGELLYGFGERFTPFVKNGQSIDIFNQDGGTSTEQSYKNIPFYVSNKGYGVFVNHPEKVSFEVGTEMVTKAEFSVEGSYLDYFFIDGPSMKDVLVKYTDLTGKPSLPAPWTFGLWLSTSFTTNYDEKTVMSFIDGMLDRGIPLRVFHFDCFWMKEFNWCDLTWDKRMFPDPKAMLDRLKAKGLEICVWINSYIAQRSSMFDEGVKGGYFLKTKDGSVWQGDMWQPGMAIVDFTNPAACEWYKGKLRALCEMGVNAFKTDFGERIPTKDVVYYDGSDPYKMHNYYTYLYNKCVFEVLEEFYGKDKACLFARSATVGGQQFPVHWGGDCFSNYESMWETLRGGLSLCMSGFGYFSHDISGFEAQGTPDLYKRWCAFGLMSSHSRLHGNSSYRVPWNFDEESCDVLRHWTKLKGKLMPYLWTQAQKTHATGVPMMRAMVMEYADDPATLSLDRQYMLGDNLLVAPVFNEEGIADFYVPAGNWTDIQSGRVYEGGKWYSTKNNYFEMPVLAKPNSIVAYGNFERAFTYAYGDKADIVIYQLEDGKSAETTIYDADSSVVLTVKAVRSGDTIKVTAEGTAKDYTIRSAEGLKVEF